MHCATPSKGACEAGGGVGVSGVAVGVVELFLSAIELSTVDRLWTRRRYQLLDEIQ